MNTGFIVAAIFVTGLVIVISMERINSTLHDIHRAIIAAGEPNHE